MSSLGENWVEKIQGLAQDPQQRGGFPEELFKIKPGALLRWLNSTFKTGAINHVIPRLEGVDVPPIINFPFNGSGIQLNHCTPIPGHSMVLTTFAVNGGGDVFGVNVKTGLAHGTRGGRTDICLHYDSKGKPTTLTVSDYGDPSGSLQTNVQDGATLPLLVYHDIGSHRQSHREGVLHIRKSDEVSVEAIFEHEDRTPVKLIRAPKDADVRKLWRSFRDEVEKAMGKKVVSWDL